ncbi:MAG: hypothetical protein SGARI_000301 [Bacillariaceae sp.]
MLSRATASLTSRRVGVPPAATTAAVATPMGSSPRLLAAISSSSHWTNTTTNTTRRHLSYVLNGFQGGGGGGGSIWPVTKSNTVFNIVPQGHKYIVERFGKLHSVEDSGWFLAIPFVDQIAYVIDIRERAMDIPPQSAITRDNVSVEVSGNLFIKFQDPVAAAYGAFNPLYSVTQHSQSAMRSAIGEMELDEILHGRARLNTLIKGALQEAALPWGLEIRRYEITEITPDHQIRIAMDKQAAAERDRREHVLRAEGDKQRAQLTSEGVKISLTNESEGTLIKIRNEAEGSKQKILLEAQGQAEAIRLTAEAQAEALQMIAAQINQEGGSEAAKLALAREYVSMYGEMGSKSNTIMFNDRPADVNALLSQAMVAMKTAGDQAGIVPPAAAIEAGPTEAAKDESPEPPMVEEEEEKKDQKD